MKLLKRLLCIGSVWLLIFTYPAVNTFAAPPDSLAKLYIRTDSMKTTLDTVKGKVDTLILSVEAVKDSIAIKKDCGCMQKDRGMQFGDWLLVFLPAVIFLTLLAVIMRTSLKEFNFKHAMSENDYPAIIKKNDLYSEDFLKTQGLLDKQNIADIVPPTIVTTFLKADGTPEPPPPSISRYIAFISSILTLAVALGVACFYIYHYIRTTCPPDLSGISTLLIALGIGVLPYAFNKMSSAIGKNKDE